LTLQVKMIGATSRDQEEKMFLDRGRVISPVVARAEVFDFEKKVLLRGTVCESPPIIDPSDEGIS